MKLWFRDLWRAFLKQPGGYMTTIFAIIGIIAAASSFFKPTLPVAITALLGVMTFSTWTLLRIRQNEVETQQLLGAVKMTLSSVNRGHMTIYRTQDAAYDALRQFAR